ncbi:MAG TPA: UDP-N-acetylmuramate dehydrogenase [Candidatus Moranbacteria bacterium]|nr:UDP-N-acetylmuramate dehydrogenase [Candidatus Moranbacteria bacterium]
MSNIKIEENIPLAGYTTFKIGGPAKFFVAVKTEKELEQAVKYAQDNGLEIFILGGGSNVLVSDDGFAGLVIHIKNEACETEGTKIKCGAGLLLSEAVRTATQNSLTGLEWASGIPGAIGGAIRGNAGAFGGEMKDNIESVEVLDLGDLQMKTYKLEECRFSYRESIFKEDENLIIFSAILNLKKGEKEKIEEKVKEIIKTRSERHPAGLASAGSFFENPTVKNKELIERFEKETGMKSREDKIPAGWLIADLGLRGKKIGQIQVSDDHANFLVNCGQGTAQEVVMLSSLIKQKVRNELGIQLREEVKYVGF